MRMMNCTPEIAKVGLLDRMTHRVLQYGNCTSEWSQVGEDAGALMCQATQVPLHPHVHMSLTIVINDGD